MSTLIRDVVSPPLVFFFFLSVLNTAGQPNLPGSSEFSALASASVS